MRHLHATGDQRFDARSADERRQVSMELVVDLAGSRSEIFCAAGLSLVHEQSPRPFHVRRARPVHDDSPAIIPGQPADARSTLMARSERSLSPPEKDEMVQSTR